MKLKTGSSTKTWKQQLPLILTMAFFLFTMLFRLTYSAPWGDEWVEYEFSQAPILTGEMYEKVISTFQPPIYNWIMHFWLMIDNSVLWFRLFNVLIGFVSGLLLYDTVRILCNQKTACICVISLAACYQWVYCIQECSEYAIMLFFLFLALWLYIRCAERFTWGRAVFFILANVGAVYSQYGSIFVVAPLLLSFLAGILLDPGSSRKKRAFTLAMYAVAFLLFAVPLYLFYLRYQMAHNQISSHTVHLSRETVKNVFLMLGQIIGYLFNLNNALAWDYWLERLCGAGTIILAAFSLFLLIRGRLNWTRKSILLSLWAAYLVHYLLVILHIYAMIHASQSAGFYNRYSYFYIPILAVALPVLFHECFCRIVLPVPKRLLMGCLAAIGAACLVYSFTTLMQNWKKGMDDEYAQIWMENRGWEDTTFVVGYIPAGFDYYITRSDGFQEEYLDRVVRSTEVDLDHLPERFWIWRTTWYGDAWRSTVDAAQEQGYSVMIFDDSGEAGQLAFCSRPA